MKITFPEKQADVAELSIDGNPVNYRIPPAIGTHSEVFQALSADKGLSAAKGKEIMAYVNGALLYRKNEWADQDKIRFPSKNYLRAPAVLTMIPKRKEFGVLEGGVLVDGDLIGEGVAKQIEVPADLSGWRASDGGVFTKDYRFFVPYDKWYQEQWDENNGMVIVLFGREGAEEGVRIAKDSKRNKPLWKVDVNTIEIPEKRVPVLLGGSGGGLLLDCGSYGGGDGCGVGVLK